MVKKKPIKIPTCRLEKKILTEAKPIALSMFIQITRTE